MILLILILLCSNAFAGDETVIKKVDAENFSEVKVTPKQELKDRITQLQQRIDARTVENALDQAEIDKIVSALNS